jgi:hypothetical protein
MSKPINVEAMRVYKLLSEICDRVKVLALLNSKVFEEIAKKELDELVHIFGPKIGPLMLEYANLEQSFKKNNIGPDGKMTAIDNEFLPEEAKKVAIKIRKSILNLVHHFQMNPKLQLKLKQTICDHRLSEYSQLIESFEQMNALW